MAEFGSFEAGTSGKILSTRPTCLKAGGGGFNRVAHSAGPGIGVSVLLRSGSLYLFLFGGPGWFGGSGWLGVGLGFGFGHQTRVFSTLFF